MDNDTTFNVTPIGTDEADAAEILFNHLNAEQFFEGLRHRPDGSWSVTFKRGETNHTLTQPNLQLLAVEFAAFSVEREQRRREQQRKAEAAKQAAEDAQRAADEAARKRQTVLGQVLGCGQPLPTSVNGSGGSRR